LNVLQAYDDVALIRANRSAYVSGTLMEDRIEQARRVTQFGQRLAVFDRLHFASRHIEFLRQVSELYAASAANLLSDLVREGVAQFVGLLSLHLRLDRGFHLIERLCAGWLAVNNLNDMKAVLGFDQIGDRSLGQAKSGRFKLRHGLAADDPIQVSAL